MIEPVKDIPLFPTLVSEYDLREYYDKEEILDTLYKIIKKKKVGLWGVAPASISSYSNGEERVLEYLPDLKAKIMGCINDYSRRAGFKSQQYESSWFNIAGQGGTLKKHDHKGCYVTATFYPVFPENSSNLIVHRPMRSNLEPQDQFTGNVGDRVTEYNNTTFELNIKEGHLYVLPAWLPHSAEKNHSDERIVIGIDTIRKGWSLAEWKAKSGI